MQVTGVVRKVTRIVTSDGTTTRLGGDEISLDLILSRVRSRLILHQMGLSLSRK